MFSFLTSTEDKPLGMCPNCKESVRARVVESNIIRRDVCKCPNCNADILICRGLECRDYALGGKHYDDEYCEACLRKFAKRMIEEVKQLPTKLQEIAEKQRKELEKQKK